MAYTKYSLTPANNNAAPPDGAPEGMLPSAVNDTMRDMMAQIRDCGDGIRGGTYTMTAPVITGGSVSGITDLAIADGGTGASTAADARTNLGLGTAATVADNTLVHLAGTETITGAKTFSVDASISGLTVGKGGGAVASNTSVGASALGSNTTGSYNVSVGRDALYSNTTAAYNTAVGYQAGYSNTTGQYNTSLGRAAGYTNSTSSQNTFIGDSAGQYTTGGFNTFVGQGSGFSITSGTKNSVIGIYSGNQYGVDIRASNNNIVLSDGDGYPQLWSNPQGLQLKASTFPSFNISALKGGVGNATVNSTTYTITFESSVKVFAVSASDGSGNLFVANYQSATITSLGSSGAIALTSTPAAGQLGIYKSANSHVINFVTGSNASATFAVWYVSSLTSGVY